MAHLLKYTALFADNNDEYAVRWRYQLKTEKVEEKGKERERKNVKQISKNIVDTDSMPWMKFIEV